MSLFAWVQRLVHGDPAYLVAERYIRDHGVLVSEWECDTCGRVHHGAVTCPCVAERASGESNTSE